MSATTVPAFEYTRPAGRGVGSRLRGLWRGPSRDPAWARPALFGLLAVTAILYLFNLSRNGYAERLLRGGGAGGHPVVEGVLLRLVRRVQLHHRRQATGLAVGGRAVRPGVRLLLLDAARAAGPRGRSLRRHPVCRRAALVRAGGGPDRGRRLRADPGGGADLPVQQSRRAAHAADDRLGVLRAAGRGTGRTGAALADLRLPAARLRVPGEDDAGVPRAARVRRRLPDRGAHLGAAPDRAHARRRARRHRGRGLVGCHRAAVARGLTALFRRVDRQQHPRTRPRLQRARAA